MPRPLERAGPTHEKESSHEHEDKLRQVPKPDVYLRGSPQGTPPPIGPRNLVEAWGVEPFRQLVGGEDWVGDQTYVLTLLATDARKASYQFCLSAEAVAEIAEGVAGDS